VPWWSLDEWLGSFVDPTTNTPLHVLGDLHDEQVVAARVLVHVEGPVREPHFATTDRVRAVSRDRLIGDPWGRVSAGVMAAIEERLRLLLGLA
jgi:mRNA-degrading endonuclease toxin of MazEF toxin-antitoxin module